MAAFRFAVLGTGSGARAFALGSGRATRSRSARSVPARVTGRAPSPTRSASAASRATTRRRSQQPVDAVYIATPPSTHRDLALAALAPGTPCSWRSPSRTDATQAREVVAEAERRGLFCMEALWTRFLPLVREVDAMLAGGAIGEVEGVTGSFGSDRVEAAHLRDPALGGGALLDRGVYPLSFVVRSLGRPVSVAAEAVTGPTGVDEECAAVLRHAGGGLSTVQASLRGELANDLRYTGTRGSRSGSAARSTVPPPRASSGPPPAGARRPGPRRTGVRPASRGPARSTPPGRTACARWPASCCRAPLRSRRPPLLRPYRGNGYHYQAEEVARCVRLGLPRAR